MHGYKYTSGVIELKYNAILKEKFEELPAIPIAYDTI